MRCQCVRTSGSYYARQAHIRREDIHADRKLHAETVDDMATRKCGLWLAVVALGSFLPAVVIRPGVGKSLICNL